MWIQWRDNACDRTVWIKWRDNACDKTVWMDCSTGPWRDNQAVRNCQSTLRLSMTLRDALRRDNQAVNNCQTGAVDRYPGCYEIGNLIGKIIASLANDQTCAVWKKHLVTAISTVHRYVHC